MWQRIICGLIKVQFKKREIFLFIYGSIELITGYQNVYKVFHFDRWRRFSYKKQNSSF